MKNYRNFGMSIARGFFAPLKQVQKARKTIDRKLQDVVIVDMSEIKIRTIMEASDMGLSLIRNQNTGYIYEE